MLSITALGLTDCNSGKNETVNASDSTSADSVNSTIISTVPTDSAHFTFTMVLDSVYQHSPKHVFKALMDGHRRFLKDSSFVYSSDKMVPDSLARIRPVLVVTDIDLNQSVEKIFDLRRSMFVELSSPACLIDPKQIAVMEYAVKYSGTKVILILSSSNSRIIGAAVDNVQTPNFGSIVNELSLATKSAPEFADRSSANKDFINNIAQSQSRLTLEKIVQYSPEIKMLADSGRIVLKSAFYDTGKKSVTVLDRQAPVNPSVKK
ncbi:hypothetical protein [Dyadobacter sandarakinus]|uniref:Carbonic anhydrase n=1 Tax=Dyadobacter sandarakinus TaxID=2747268 RepID=A0ABX7I4P1_9BACT|nr:hypothetical protein [Dyadobacter sandarakinus]QRR00833.1 hypothetical protein HWI92_07875 [Dyadobacter sandarakinus]